MANSKDGETHRGRGTQVMKKIGRPRILRSPEQLDALVDEYVQQCRDNDEPLTLTGLILHVGLSSRSALDNYEGRPGFLNSVKRAKLLIENGYEIDLRRTGNPAGSIFALKNMGWSDRQEFEFRGVLHRLDLNRLPDDLIARLAAGENPISVLAPILQDPNVKLPALGPGKENAAGE